MPYLVFGLVGTISGVFLFYFFPYSIVNLNLSLMFNIFFMLLIGMIFGWSMIALNIQRTLELIIVYTLIVWEKKSMKILIQKNLSAHRESNQLTSLIYSLTLGCIIFVVVSSSTQIGVFQTYPWGDITWIAYNPDWYGVIEKDPTMRPVYIDPVIKQYS